MDEHGFEKEKRKRVEECVLCMHFKSSNSELTTGSDVSRLIPGWLDVPLNGLDSGKGLHAQNTCFSEVTYV